MASGCKEMLSLNGLLNGQPFLAQITEDLLEDAGGMGYHGGSAGLGSGEQTHQSAESYQPAISSRAWTVFHPTYISGAQC